MNAAQRLRASVAALEVWLYSGEAPFLMV